MKQTLLAALIVLSVGIITTSCENDYQGMPESEKTPKEIENFISKNFPTAYEADLEIVNSEDPSKKVYTVMLTNGISIEFDKNKNWKYISGNPKEIPLKLIPEKICSYLAQHYPNQLVDYICNTGDGFTIRINNTILYFDKDDNLSQTTIYGS